jgi:murein DD-endopeptidase MepM/ murein hydrolase activator NlpD
MRIFRNIFPLVGLSIAMCIMTQTVDAQTYEHKGDATINYLKNQIENTYQKVYSGSELMQQIESRLTPIKQKIETLKDQIEILDDEYRNTQKKIQDVQKQTAVKEKEIELLMLQLTRYEKESREQKTTLVDLGKLLYDNQKQYIDFSSNGKKINNIKLLLSSSILSEVANNNSYLQSAGEIAGNILQNHEENLQKLELTNNILSEKRDKLDKLNKKLVLQKNILATQKEAKKILLDFTNGSETAYQDLLTAARDEQKKIVEEIKGYQGQLASIERLLNQFGTEHKISDSIFEWPVDPSGGITAYFHDDGYSERFGLEHNAVDIRAAENTEIRAPDDGYVFKVHDGGMGYSYIIIAHRNNMMTVYGHVMQILVEEGDIISRDDIIGLTGGSPGTKGAGYLTTGPHLHFEVYKDGQHIDPLVTLPIFDGRLPKNYIPKEFF